MYSTGVYTAAPETTPDKPITFDLSLVGVVVVVVIVVVVALLVVTDHIILSCSQ